MKKEFLFAAVLAASFAAPNAFAADDVYYARCNIKVLKGNKITYVNYQSAPEFISAGTKLKVSASGSSATFTDDKGTSYSVDLGASGDKALEKFVTRKRIDVSKAAGHFAGDVKRGIAKVGMTREQVYITMCAPPYIDGKNDTSNMGYSDIMKGKMWVYRRMKIGKTIGIEFGSNGKVSRTEGIWTK